MSAVAGRAMSALSGRPAMPRVRSPMDACWRRTDGSITEPYFFEVAREPLQLEHGLMFRTELLSRSGLFFLFREYALHGFWMKNTGIPLDLAWLLDDGTLTQMAQLHPHDLRIIRPTVPVRYAVEVAANTLQFDGVGIGARLVLTS